MIDGNDGDTTVIGIDRESDALAQPLALPCGAILANRLVKAAMEEDLADGANHADGRLARLYRRWSEGGAGLLITGNVQVDRRYLGLPGDVAVEGDDGLDALSAWVAAGTAAGNHLWMQLNHAGRQTPRTVTATPVAPSPVPMDAPGGRFAPPRALADEEIVDIVGRFARAARVAQAAGFTGIEVHAAHGYLLSQFLSPHVNRRTDRWGGDLSNRARLLLEVVRAVRHTVGPAFPVAVKLNSADFQAGGFSLDDCCQVVAWLSDEGIDLLEISGGTLERPAFAGAASATDVPARASTRRREAYFLDYARTVRRVARMPLLVTSGFRSRAAMEEAVGSGDTDLVGLARPLCVDPHVPRRLLERTVEAAPADERTLRLGPGPLGPTSPLPFVRTLNGWGAQAWFNAQLLRMGDGQDPDRALGVLMALIHFQRHDRRTVVARRAAFAPDVRRPRASEA